jgi:hypothetical protein
VRRRCWRVAVPLLSNVLEKVRVGAGPSPALLGGASTGSVSLLEVMMGMGFGFG